MLNEFERSFALQAATVVFGSTNAHAAAGAHPSERVVMFERRTGKIITGPLAPTEGTLFIWLRRHPTFEVLQPNASQSSTSEAKVNQFLVLLNSRLYILKCFRH